ncbi:Aconitase A (AcnA) (PDB:1ACO) [Commensalibacter communis]|uniref:Aconitate hydratase n=1 Tax=Commensalibacter communis TaxID=2972786 RepID=A0A9W4TNQ9_9PROT|nr:aconitate hydratase AcnA [Commensalibacter communis]CAI3939516.1 Aconitase A (AcnA) (PDB:1ACO) [Commensalibacter communis]CAI3940836.1 Aconitase A (AcnA) (PDB:1ACO) [Commensalibacter communis]CAI3942647.1 Aconitase A (AcnA) (PDB:1ACO) [Commensalibacter communis]CAI3947108.1 Aconitase A (AcnA) (PDB:1ACO) [Commensalibacter communis]
MKLIGQDSLKTCRTLDVDGKNYHYFSLPEAEKQIGSVKHLPVTLKVLLENILRFENGKAFTVENAKSVVEWLKNHRSDSEVPFRPARILMQDFTGVPAVVDLAAMREGMISLKGDPQKVNPLIPVNLVIDHSVMVDYAGSSTALTQNITLEFERNAERYAFLRWGQEAFKGFSVVPPDTGICHQVNLEHIAKVVWHNEEDGKTYAYPDTLYGTDSHTTMINGLGVLGWGVGGIEAEAAMLGQPITMLIPDVIGFKLTGKLAAGVTATDLVLKVTEMLRKKGVVGKFVEFFGPALDHLPLYTRATIANMAPEYGATCGFFPVDQQALDYLRLTGRDEHQIKLVEAYLKAQGMFRDANAVDPEFTDTLELDIGTVVPSISGPRRPQDRIDLSAAKTVFEKELTDGFNVPAAQDKSYPVANADYELEHGSVVIAAITSCTNTSNAEVMMAAGLLAKKAHALGLTRKPWVKTSLAPGSKVATNYLQNAGLIEPLNALGFNIVGYGCTTCIGNSGPLEDDIIDTIENNKMVATAVLSGNRNFEGRISPNVRANYLASPPLVVAYAILGTLRKDITKDPIGVSKDGKEIYLKDIWPSAKEISDAMASSITKAEFLKGYDGVEKGPKEWQALSVATGSQTYSWDEKSTYVRNPPYFDGMGQQAPATRPDIKGARVLAILADNVTTDHISPAGSIRKDSPAGRYLTDHGVKVEDFNSYGSRRGNHEVMMRGTFANIRIRNEMVPGVEGGYSKHYPDGKEGAIYDVAMQYMQENTPLVVFGGKEYGMGSSRDWAAKGTNLLGVKAVVAESFERIHRSNLVGMGVLPLLFEEGTTRKTLNLKGDEQIDILGVETLQPRQKMTMRIHRADGSTQDVQLICRVDTQEEVEYYRHGGILPYVLRLMAE